MTTPSFTNEPQGTKPLLDAIASRRQDVQKLRVQFAEDNGEVTIPATQAPATSQAGANAIDTWTVAGAMSQTLKEEKEKTDAQAAAEKRLEEAEKMWAARKSRIVQRADRRPDVFAEVVDALGSAAPPGLTVHGELAECKGKIRVLRQERDAALVEVESLAQKIAGFETAELKSEALLDNAVKNSEALTRQLDNVEQQLADAVRDKDVAAQHLVGVRAELTTTMEAKEKLAAQLANWEEASKELEAELADAWEELATTARTKEELAVQLATTVQAKEELSIQLANWEEASKELETELAEAWEELATTANTKEELAVQLANRVEASKELEAELAEAWEVLAATAKTKEELAVQLTAAVEAGKELSAQLAGMQEQLAKEKQAEVDSLQEQLTGHAQNADNLERLVAILMGQPTSPKIVVIASLIRGEKTDRPAVEAPEAWTVAAPWLSGDALEAVAVPEGDQLLVRPYMSASCGDLASPSTLAMVASLTRILQTAATLNVKAVAEILKEAEGIKGADDAAQNAAVFAWWQLACLFWHCWLEVPSLDSIGKHLTGPFQQLAEAVATRNSVWEVTQSLGKPFGDLVMIRADALNLLMVDPHSTTLTAVALTQAEASLKYGVVFAPAGIQDIVVNFSHGAHSWAWAELCDQE